MNPMPSQSIPNNNLQQIGQMIKMARSGMNPQMMIQNMMYQNPQVRQIMESINQYGGDPKTAFYRLAQQRGIDPNQIIGMIKQNF